jgi:hypothetical protein
MSTPTVLYIHGANASSMSWNYLRDKVLIERQEFAEYTSNHGFYKNLDAMISNLNDGPYIIVGHSLGGIYGMHLAHHLGDRFVGGVSISTPFGGVTIADWAAVIYPFIRLFKDVGISSTPIAESHHITESLNKPWLKIISTKGHVPWILGKNDGVVTIASQHINALPFVEIPTTHYESVMSEKTAIIINKFLLDLPAKKRAYTFSLETSSIRVSPY